MKPKKKEMSMYVGGGKTKPMNMYKGKVYEEGGLLAALLKDPKQRAAAKKMLGSMEKGGMVYEKGGTVLDKDKDKKPTFAERISEIDKRMQSGNVTKQEKLQLAKRKRSMENQLKRK